MLYHKKGKRKRNNLQHIILQTVVSEGTLTIDSIANHLSRYVQSVLGKTRSTNPQYNFSRAVNRLVEKGILKIEKGKNEGVLTLTAKGKEMMHKIKYGEIELQRPKHWDKKWRLVIYDIKEERKKMREQLKDALRNVGFVAIQKSVWAYPYPCEDLLVMLRADFGVGKEVLYVVVEKLENDNWVRNHFHLDN